MIRRVASIQIPVPRSNPWNISFSVEDIVFSKFKHKWNEALKNFWSIQINSAANSCLLKHLWAPWAQHCWIFFTTWALNKNLHKYLYSKFCRNLIITNEKILMITDVPFFILFPSNERSTVISTIKNRNKNWSNIKCFNELFIKDSSQHFLINDWKSLTISHHLGSHIL